MTDTNTINLLKALGILDENLRVTPEAFVGHVTRLPVNRQAEAIGIPLILLPPPTGNQRPEDKVAAFFRKIVGFHVDFGFEESYLLKSLLGSLIGGFQVKKKKHRMSDFDIARISDEVARYQESDVVVLLERNNVIFRQHFGWVYGVKMPDSAPHEKYGHDLLLLRFAEARYEKLRNAPLNDQVAEEEQAQIYLSSKVRALQYAQNMSRYLWLWRSLSPDEWGRFISIVLKHWDKMATGWPDVCVVSEDYGLLLVEVKGRDKLHTSQIYTLLKLKEALGCSRVAIAWANRIAMDLTFDNRIHQESVIRWACTNQAERENTLRHPELFYDKNKALDQT